MRALIAFDKFKDALTAHEVCRVASEALKKAHPSCAIRQAPLADGGDGFCDVLTQQVDGDFHDCSVIGPDGTQAAARLGIVSTSSLQSKAVELLRLSSSIETIAIIEMAQASGISMIPQERRSPWNTTSAGLGDLMRFAAQQGARACIVGLGGSATHDVALGALWRLGYQFIEHDGTAMTRPPTPERWSSLARIEAPQDSLSMELRIACDVENPLLGPKGAAAIFGPQKGLKEEEWPKLENETKRVANLLLQTTGQSRDLMKEPGAGAAGGTALGLLAAFPSEIISGFELARAWIDLETKLDWADIVITGEGRFDASSWQGKGPGSLAKDALERGKEVYVLAGSLGEIDEPTDPQIRLHAITPSGMELAEALAKTEKHLAQSVRELFANQ